MTKKTLAYILILITCITTGIAFAILKLAAGDDLVVGWRIFYFCLAALIMFLNLFLFLTAYKYERISVLYPITALTYPITFGLGVLVFGEAPTTLKIVGTLFVIVGAFTMARKEIG